MVCDILAGESTFVLPARCHIPETQAKTLNAIFYNHRRMQTFTRWIVEAVLCIHLPSADKKALVSGLWCRTIYS